MSNQSFIDMETETTEVKAVHGLPFEILPEGTQKLSLADSESHDR